MAFVKTSCTLCAYWDDNHKAFEKELPGKAEKLLSQTSGVESCVMLKQVFKILIRMNARLKSDNGFAWISAQPLMEPLLNMHLILRAIPAIHEINALREVS